MTTMRAKAHEAAYVKHTVRQLRDEMWARQDEDTSKERVFAYLNDLRDSGETNMFGAAPYLRAEFGVTGNESKAMLADWMDSFKGAE